MKMGEIGCPKIPVTNYHSVLCKLPEECRYAVEFVYILVVDVEHVMV